MSVYRLKPAFQGLLRPLVGALARAGVTANAVTVAAALMSLGAGGFLALALASGSAALTIAALLALPATLLVRMALNAVDGMLAREHGQASLIGAYLNELGDVVSDTALILPFALLSPLAAVGTVAVALLAALSELAGIAGHAVGAGRRYDGPMGKSDRALALGLLATVLAIMLSASASPVTLAHLTSAVMTVMAALLVLTIYNRVRSGIAAGGGA